MSMSQRMVLITEIISPYRIPVLNALAHQSGSGLHVIFLAETDDRLRAWRVYKQEIRFSYEVLPSMRFSVTGHKILVNRRLWSALEQASPEVVVCGGYNYPASWEALWWARRRRARFVLWTESNRYDHRSRRIWVEGLKQYFLRRCDAFVVPGKASLSYLQDFGVSEQNIFTAPNAVDTFYFATASEAARLHEQSHRRRLGLPERFLLYAGRLVPEKGVLDLLEAYARLDVSLRAKLGLVFVGDGVAHNDLVARSQSISPGRVCFPGFAQREDLAVYYSLADVLVLPTHSDTWGLVVNEAMVCGLPIIVTSVAGCAPDLVEDGWNGWVVPPRDHKRLSTAIRNIVEQPEIRKQMSANSRERIRRYSPEECARGLAEAIRAERMSPQ